MSEPFPALDPRAARRNSERAARSYAGASRLEAEVAARMQERLDYVKLAPRRILDAGCGSVRRSPQRRYPRAQLVALDFSLAMLVAGRRRFFEKRKFVCADLARLPLAAGTVDLVWSNMSLHWVREPLAALREFARVLAPEGLLTFSTLGPDTLKELRAAAGGARVHAFIDMHDLGDMLVAAGFSAPVMDMEMLTLTYAAGTSLVDDLRASGQRNARADRARGLASRRLRTLASPPRASFEVVYGHAWKGAPRGETATKTVRVFPRIP